jgi:ribonuclease HIII
MTFESFVQSLIAASERYNRLIPLRDNLMSMIGQYQDCVKACEHQHSKRTFERVSDSFTRPEICKYEITSEAGTTYPSGASEVTPGF